MAPSAFHVVNSTASSASGTADSRPSVEMCTCRWSCVFLETRGSSGKCFRSATVTISIRLPVQWSFTFHGSQYGTVCRLLNFRPKLKTFLFWKRRTQSDATATFYYDFGATCKASFPPQPSQALLRLIYWDLTTRCLAVTCGGSVGKCSRLTLLLPIPLRLYTLPCWPNPSFLIFDIRTLWRSGLTARAS